MHAPIGPDVWTRQWQVATLLRVAMVTGGLAESNGSLPPILWLTSPAGWLPRTGISSRNLHSAIEYGLPYLNPALDNHRYTQIVSRKSLKWTTGKSQPSPYHTDWLSCGFTSHSSVFYETDRQTDRRIVVVVDIRHARVRHQSPVHHRHQYCFQHRLCLCLGLLVNSKVTTDSYK